MKLLQSALLAMSVVVIAATHDAFAEDLRIANEGGIGAWWMLANGTKIVAPGYPPMTRGLKRDACVAVGYIIQPDGTTTDHVIVKHWADGPVEGDVDWDGFGRASSLALGQWRFAPKPGVPARPTFTVATFAFGATGTPAPDIRAKCQVQDVMTAVLTARQDAHERGSLNGQWLDQVYREAWRREIRTNQANRCRTSHGMAANCLD